MANLSQVELQNLRHLIGAHDTSYQKLNTYASQCVDIRKHKGKFNNIPRCNFRSRKHATKTNNTTNKK